ncbi:MAG TPA: LysR family transcriptional regulator [Vicinamibacteria bacterium]|nr:LysR family transcriptional regulator [Vicinamibacteria bacterium]
MDVRQLDMFRAVAEERSFTRAAERLHVSQSAISRQVKLLEDELGGRLLYRGGKGATLTPPGELLLRLANRVHRDMQDVVGQIAETHGLLRGSLTIAGGMTVCMHVLPRVLKQYRRLYKGVDLRVVSGPTESLLRLLRAHEVDLALLTLPLAERDMEVVPVLREEMVVVTAPGHPLARLRSVDAPAIARFPLILYEAGSNSRRVQDKLFAEAAVPVKVAMETENVEIIKAMVGAGLGITLIPWAAIAKDAKSGRFAVTRVRGRHLRRETGWVYLKSEWMPRTVTAMLELFQKMKKDFRGPEAAGTKLP